jgi:ribonuclease P protein component
MKTARKAGLPRTERLLRRADFLRAQAAGRRLHGKLFVLQLHSRGDELPARLGVTVSRKVGNSVVRHQIKRWIREVFRCNKELFHNGDDCVVIAREGAVIESFAQVQAELLALISQRNRGKSSSTHGKASTTSAAGKSPGVEKNYKKKDSSAASTGQSTSYDAKHSGSRSNKE